MPLQQWTTLRTRAHEGRILQQASVYLPSIFPECMGAATAPQSFLTAIRRRARLPKSAAQKRCRELAVPSSSRFERQQSGAARVL